jgi:hypothetical protein
MVSTADPVKYTTRKAASAHHDDAVLGDEPVAQGGEARGHPAVHGHVGQHARAAKEAGLRGDEEQRAGGGQRRIDKGVGQGQGPGLGDFSNSTALSVRPSTCWTW